MDMNNDTPIALPKGITEAMWWKMCDCQMELPIALDKADLSQPFIYERKWGVFYVPSGYHQAAMSLLLAFQHGLVSGVEVAKKLNLKHSEETADHWLEFTQGAAFRSSVGKKINVATTKNLSIHERRYFGEVLSLFEL
jgi:hypothetical protein